MVVNSRHLQMSYRTLYSSKWTSHLQLKEFVSATSQSTDCLSSVESNGDEISAFYDSVVQSSSVGQSDCRKERPYDGRKSKTKRSLTSCKPGRSVDQQPLSTSRFFYYAQQGDVSSLEWCLQQGFNIDSKDEFGWTALMCASCSGALDAVKFLLERHADHRVFDKTGRSAWKLAFKNGHREVASLIQRNVKNRSACEVKVKVEIPDLTIPHSTFTFCDTCQEYVADDTYRTTHLASIVHQLNVGKSDSSTSFANYHIPENNIGFQLMLKDGWDRDKGLGPSGSGQRYPPKTVLKRDRYGFGSDAKQKAKITHFGPKDTNAIATRNVLQLKHAKNRYRREFDEKKAKQKEIDFRREWNSFEP